MLKIAGADEEKVIVVDRKAVRLAIESMQMARARNILPQMLGARGSEQ